jgi:hypothetical protein
MKDPEVVRHIEKELKEKGLDKYKPWEIPANYKDFKGIKISRVSAHKLIGSSLSVDDDYYEKIDLYDFIHDQVTGNQVNEEKEEEKPRCKLIGTDGNVFSLMGKVSTCLKRAGKKEEAKQVIKDIQNNAGSYDEALQIMSKYVDIY